MNSIMFPKTFYKSSLIQTSVLCLIFTRPLSLYSKTQFLSSLINALHKKNLNCREGNNIQVMNVKKNIKEL